MIEMPSGVINIQFKSNLWRCHSLDKSNDSKIKSSSRNNHYNSLKLHFPKIKSWDQNQLKVEGRKLKTQAIKKI